MYKHYSFLLFLCGYLAFASRLFKYENWTEIKGSVILLIISIASVLIAFWGQRKRRSLYFDKTVYLLMTLPFLGLVTKLLYYNEGLNSEVTILHFVAAFSVYFIFVRQKTSFKLILNSLTIIAIAAFVIQVVQQIMPESAVFGIYDEEASTSKIADMRNGLYRFRIGSYSVTLFCLYYYWDKVIKRYSLKYAILSIIMFASLYLTLTRQLIVSGIFCMMLAYLQNRRRITLWGGYFLSSSPLFYMQDLTLSLASMLKARKNRLTMMRMSGYTPIHSSCQKSLLIR